MRPLYTIKFEINGLIGQLKIIVSDEVGLSFLIFFWKMRKKNNYPVNPVNPVQKIGLK
jgi:hypothetical protein